MFDPRTNSAYTHLNNHADELSKKNKYAKAIKDLLSGLFFSKKYDELPAEFQFIGDQAAKILLNTVGDKLGFENRPRGLASIQQGVLAAGGLPLVTSSGESMGMAYGQGASAMAMAYQIEGIIDNFYEDKDGKIKIDNVGALTYSMLAEASAQIIKERGFKEGDIITHQYGKGSKGVEEGIQTLLKKDIKKDNAGMHDAYLALALTKRKEELEQEYEANLTSETQIRLADGSIQNVKDAITELEGIEAQLKSGNLNDAERINLMNRAAVLQAVAPHRALQTVKKFENEKNLTEEEATQLREARKFMESNRYDYVSNNMLNKQIDVTDEEGKLLEENHLISKGDLYTAQAASNGQLTGEFVNDKWRKDMEQALRAAKSNLEILKQTFDTEDFHKLQEIAKELGMGSLTKKENVEKVRDNLNRAATLASISGRDLKEILIEQGDIRENLSKVLGIEKEYINSDLVAYTQQQYAQHVENFNKGYTKITPGQRQAILLEQRGNALDLGRYELLAQAIANDDAYSYITSESPEAQAQLNEVLDLYEQARNAPTHEQYMAIRGAADAKMAAFKSNWLTHLSPEQLRAISESQLTDKYMERKAIRDVYWNAKEAVELMKEDSSLANAIRSTEVAPEDEHFIQNWQKTIIDDTANVAAIFGDNRGAFEAFIEKAQTQEGFDSYVQELDAKLQKVGRTEEERKEIISRLKALSPVLLTNKVVRSYVIDSIYGNRNIPRGAVNAAEEEAIELQKSITNLVDGRPYTMTPTEQFRAAIMEGHEVSMGAALLSMLESGDQYKDKGYVTTDADGKIIVDGDKINADTQETKGLYYIDIKDLDSVRNNKKLLKALGLDNIPANELSDKAIKDALFRFKDNEGTILSLNNNDTKLLLAELYAQNNARVYSNAEIERQREKVRDNKNLANETLASSYVNLLSALPDLAKEAAAAYPVPGSGVHPIIAAVKNLKSLEATVDNKAFDVVLDKLGYGDFSSDIKERLKAAIAIIKKYDAIDNIDANQTANYSPAKMEQRLSDLIKAGRLDATEIESLTKHGENSGLNPNIEKAIDKKNNPATFKDFILNLIGEGEYSNIIKSVFSNPDSIASAVTTVTETISNLKEVGTSTKAISEPLAKLDQTWTATSNNIALAIDETLGVKLDNVGQSMEAVNKELQELNSIFNSVKTGNALNTKLTA